MYTFTIEGKTADQTLDFFDSAPTLGDYRTRIFPVDFTDLDNQPDMTMTLFRRLCAMLVLFVMVFAGTAWFINDNLDTRRQNEETNIWLSQENVAIGPQATAEIQPTRLSDQTREL